MRRQEPTGDTPYDWQLWEHVVRWEYATAALTHVSGPERVAETGDDYKPKPFIGFRPGRATK